MNPLVSLYNELLWRPLFNGLVWLYVTLPIQDLGLAIIFLTIAIRLILAPVLIKGQRAQKTLATLQPEIKRLQNEHKNNKEGQGKALMALFQVFQKGFDPALLSFLYGFVQNPGALNPVSFGVLDLAKGNIYLGIFAAASQFFQT